MRRSLFDFKSYDEINVTPLLDLAFTLLIVFIIAVTASIQGIKVNLPKASNTPALTQPKTKSVSITSTGQIYLDAYPVSLEELEARMRYFKALTPDLPVVIKGDAQVQYERVIQVLDLMGNLEITQLGLVTQQLVK
jgi:biopolymer transport protein ExbD